MAEVAALGPRPREPQLRAVIKHLCAWRALRPAELAAILGVRADNLTKRHLSAMVDKGILVRSHPATPNHPDQAYSTRQLPLSEDS
jgi:ATP-dependent DNA helicase RecG